MKYTKIKIIRKNYPAGFVNWLKSLLPAIDPKSSRKSVQADKLLVKFVKLKLPIIKNIIKGREKAFKNLNKSTLNASIITIDGPMVSVLFKSPIMLNAFK